MKNKKTIYVLLPIVLIIWGAVLYQFFSISAPENLNPGSNGLMHSQPLAIKAKDTFSINVQYRDPFLGKMYYQEASTKPRKRIVAVVKSKPKEATIWPSIVYKGIVSDTKDKNRVFMLIINGRTALMKAGDFEEELLLKSGNKESVHVSFQKKSAIIPLQQ